jgi:5-formyltetrahydrofolate cyclo-ligase
MNEKAVLRCSMKEKLASLDLETFKMQGIDAGKLITANPIWNKAQTILAFMPMRREIDVHFLLDAALSAKKNLFVPRIINDNMEFFKIDNLKGPWDEGSFGILEPKINDAKQFSQNNIEFPVLIIVPGLAFDKKGHRLGRGKGFYDRFLSNLKQSREKNAENITFLGICLCEQLVDHVPTEEFDQKIDAICTGNEYIDKCSKLG